MIPLPLVTTRTNLEATQQHRYISKSKRLSKSKSNVIFNTTVLKNSLLHSKYARISSTNTSARRISSKLLYTYAHKLRSQPRANCAFQYDHRDMGYFIGYSTICDSVRLLVVGIPTQVQADIVIIFYFPAKYSNGC